MTLRWRPNLRASLWNVADFRDLWLSQTVSLVGTGITLLALPLVSLFLLDASPFEISLLWAVEYLPILLVGLPAGAWVERLPLRLVMVVADVGRALALLVVPLAVWLDVLSMPLMYAVAFWIGLGTLFFDVAQLSILPELVEERRLVDANGKLEVSRSLAQVGGPGIGGVLVQLLTGPLALLADAVTYLTSAYFVLRIRKPPRRDRPVERMDLRREIREGIRFVFGHSKHLHIFTAPINVSAKRYPKALGPLRVMTPAGSRSTRCVRGSSTTRASTVRNDADARLL
ncbi:MFS transporter [Pseudonocardia humida]|uniref:MFS transporter n=1 Tax=Pseudonocardia humida TaxID=2800819 RepID=A0ABT1A231_9PSEU|nr:MFS transporter [Pseudonocardia humida]MCO1656975.1 MFS transporter [Pseudonocardia humida]